MLYSIVITYHDPLLKKYEMLSDLIRSIGENSQGKEVEIVLVSNAHSYCEAVNEGLRRAKGNWIVVMNDDVKVADNRWLDKLCGHPDSLTSFQHGSFSLKGSCFLVADGGCWAMPRNIFEKLGLMDEAFSDGFNFEDTDYFLRAATQGIPIVNARVDLYHLGGATTKLYFSDSVTEKINRNREIFNAKWSAYDPVTKEWKV